MTKEFTDDEIKEMKSIFDLFDRQMEGIVEIEGLGTLMRSCGSFPMESEIDKIKEQLLSENKNYFDFDKFVEIMMKKYKEFDPENELLESFKVFDVENEGKVEVDIFQHVMKKHYPDIEDEKLQEILQSLQEDEKVDFVKNFERIISH